MPRIPGTNDVIGLPPAPWPLGYSTPYTGSLLDDGTGRYTGAGWARPGSTYFWTLGMLVNRLLQLGTDGVIQSKSEVDAAVRAVLDVLAPDETVEAVELAAESDALPVLLLPGYTEVPGMTYSYVSAQIHATLGHYEEVSHTLALVHSGTSQAPDSLAPADLQAIAQGVGQAWQAFIQDQSGVAAFFANSLVYDKVVCAAKTVSGPAPKTGSRKGLVRNEGASAEWAFPAGVAGTGNQPLPFQTALVLSLGTGMKGAHYRGRLYLGGLSTTVTIGPDGNISASLADTIGLAFGTNVIAGLSRGAWHVNVWSSRLAAGREVSNVYVGQVLDTMRSRRRSLKETPTLAWGTA